MFIRIGIGKFTLSFGNARKSLDRREDGPENKKPLPGDEERRTEDERRGQDPFPEKDSTGSSNE